MHMEYYHLPPDEEVEDQKDEEEKENADFVLTKRRARPRPLHRKDEEDEAHLELEHKVAYLDDPTSAITGVSDHEDGVAEASAKHGITQAMEPAGGQKEEEEANVVDASIRRCRGREIVEAPISASLGAMRPLVEKLQRMPPNSKLALLRDDVEELSAYLDDLAEAENPPPMARCGMKAARELSYDIQDYIIDCNMNSRFRKKTTTKKKQQRRKLSLINHVIKIPKRLKCYKQKVQMSYIAPDGTKTSKAIHINGTCRFNRPKNIAKEMKKKIQEFRIHVQEVIEQHERYRCSAATLRRPGRLVAIGPLSPTPPYEETAGDIVIGSRTSDNEFVDSLLLASHGDHHQKQQQQQQLKVVSILGSACIGKTTLARSLCNKFEARFDCVAFARVSKKPDIRRLLYDLLSQVQPQQQLLPQHSLELHLIDSITKHLQDKRYLIIIDDLWATSVWDIIKCAFPEGDCGSLIITTTQIEDVALACCCYHPEHVFEMKPLDDDHSRKLFFNRLFGSEGDCPEELKEVLNKIVELCGGLPLATISIASLLARQPVISIELLTHIHDSLSSCLSLSDSSEKTRQVLNLSYNNLPHHLKTCLMYLITYPEGHVILKEDLVKQWMAEGFIDTAQGQDMEEVAGRYFDELVDRRFIQPVCINHRKEVVSCTVHDMVHDLIAYQSAEDNFIVVIDHNRKNVSLSHKVRRLSLLFGEAKYAKIPANITRSQVRSLTFLGLFKCVPCITEFKLLRLLNLQLLGHHGDDDTINLTGFFELVHLRYLKIACDACIQLPNHMRVLQCLETLDVMGTRRVTAVPWDIMHLPHLLHLSLPVETNLLDGIGSDTVVNLWSLGMLNYLQGLHLTSSSTPLERKMEALGSLLGGHGNLTSLALVHKNAGASRVVIISWDRFVAPPLLQRFELSPHMCMFSGVPKWMGQLGNLCVLKIAVRELLMKGVDILSGLPALTSMSLYVQQMTPADRIVFHKDRGFSVLSYFKFRCSVPWLCFEADAMPNLRKLKLGFNAPRPGVNQHQSIIIEQLTGLKEISAKIGGAAAADARSTLTLVSNHPRNPRINVQLVDYIFYADESTEMTQAKRGIYDNTIELYSHPIAAGAKGYDLQKILHLQKSHDLYCPNCNSCITRRVILRDIKVKQTGHDEAHQFGEPSGLEEYDLEKILHLQKTHNLYCPNCNSCITRKVILQRRKKLSSIPADSAKKPLLSDTQSSSVTTTSFAGAATTSSDQRDDKEILHIVYTGFVEIMTRLFPALARTSIPPAFNPAKAPQFRHAQSCNYSCSSATASTSYVHGHGTIVKPAQLKEPLPNESSYQLQTTTTTKTTTTPSYKSCAADVQATATSQIAKFPSPIHHPSVVPASPDHLALSMCDPAMVCPLAPISEQRDEWDILKAIIYGGLVESITSLSIVSAAAASGAKTLDIFVLGIANLIGGIPLIFHKINDLRYLGDLGENDTHYWLQLGGRSKFQLHMVLALISYIMFGLLPPVIYGLSFNRENKMMAVAAASLFCVALLAIGKAHVKRPRSYIKTLMYYLMIAVSASGLSYVAGVLITRLLVHFGLIDQGASPAAPAPPSLSFPYAAGARTSAWASF